MEAGGEFISHRAVEAELKRYKYATFDKMVDLALDGIVTLPEAIKGFQEQLDEADQLQRPTSQVHE